MPYQPPSPPSSRKSPTLMPAWASSRAANSPAGPQPTTTTDSAAAPLRWVTPAGAAAAADGACSGPGCCCWRSRTPGRSCSRRTPAALSAAESTSTRYTQALLRESTRHDQAVIGRQRKSAGEAGSIFKCTADGQMCSGLVLTRMFRRCAARCGHQTTCGRCALHRLGWPGCRHRRRECRASWQAPPAAGCAE